MVYTIAGKMVYTIAGKIGNTCKTIKIEREDGWGGNFASVIEVSEG